MMPEVPMCCLRLHGKGADTLLIQCKLTKSHIRAALEELTDNCISAIREGLISGCRYAPSY